MRKARIFRKIEEGIVECPGCKHRLKLTLSNSIDVRLPNGDSVVSLRCPECGATEHEPPEAAPDCGSEPTIETVGGHKIDPFDLRPEDVDVRDIAFSLSNICRWHGHIDRSDLEHSLDAMDLVRQWGHPVATQFAALVHDAQEYVLNDLARGVKRRPSMSAYREAEAHAVEVLRVLWGIKTAGQFHVDVELERIVKRADNALLFLEADRWLPSRGRTFSGWCEEVAACVEEYRDSFPALRVATKPRLRRMFLNAFANLRRGRAGGGIIVGLTGYAGSGKDTFAEVLLREGGFSRAAFADPIKQECATFAGITVAELEEEKERWRLLLQHRGQWMRDKSATHWIDLLRVRFDYLIGEENISVYAPSFVITDVRHANEAEFIRGYSETRGMESLIIRVRRADQPAVTEDPHESERGVDDVAADREVTTATVEDKEQTARDFLSGNWDDREK